MISRAELCRSRRQEQAGCVSADELRMGAEDAAGPLSVPAWAVELPPEWATVHRRIEGLIAPGTLRQPSDRPRRFWRR